MDIKPMRATPTYYGKPSLSLFQHLAIHCGGGSLSLFHQWHFEGLGFCAANLVSLFHSPQSKPYKPSYQKSVVNPLCTALQSSHYSESTLATACFSHYSNATITIAIGDTFTWQWWCGMMGRIKMVTSFAIWISHAATNLLTKILYLIL